MKQLFYGSSNNYALLLLKRSTFLLCKVYVGHAARAYPCTRSVIGQQLAQLHSGFGRVFGSCNVRTAFLYGIGWRSFSFLVTEKSRLHFCSFLLARHTHSFFFLHDISQIQLLDSCPTNNNKSSGSLCLLSMVPLK